jgi:hypothetical protein
MAENFWDKLSGDDEHAADYMLTYGEGPGCPTRHTLGSFINDGERYSMSAVDPVGTLIISQFMVHQLLTTWFRLFRTLCSSC